MYTTEEFVKKANFVSFDHYREGNLYYQLSIFVDRECSAGTRTRMVKDIEYWTFPIPIEDTKGATFNHMHKPIDLMRWIRKAVKNGTMVRYYPKGGQQVNKSIPSGNDKA